MTEATLIFGRHTRIRWNRSGHSISALMLSTTSGVHRRVGATGRPLAQLATTISDYGLTEQLKRRAVAAIRPSAFGGAYGT